MDVVAAAHPDRFAGEVDVAPLEREQLAEAQPGERGGQVKAPVLLRAGRADERVYFLG